jgi:hypothetical protein
MIKHFRGLGLESLSWGGQVDVAMRILLLCDPLMMIDRASPASVRCLIGVSESLLWPATAVRVRCTHAAD